MRVAKRSLPVDFAEAQDELTPSLMEKRRVVARHFEDVVEEMYSAHRKPDVHK